MKTTNKDLMAQARAALSGKWGLAVGALAIVTLINIAAEIVPVVNFIVPLIIAGPLALGVAIFTLAIARNKETKVTEVFSGFDRFATALATYLLSLLFIILWALLLIIPGIIAALSYSQIYFILADNPSIGAMEAIDRSKKMMMGNKWKIFCLGWRFFGWALLCVLTLGIGFLWLFPYMSVTFAKFYEDIKNTENKEEVTKVVEIVETVPTKE